MLSGPRCDIHPKVNQYPMQVAVTISTVTTVEKLMTEENALRIIDCAAFVKKKHFAAMCRMNRSTVPRSNSRRVNEILEDQNEILSNYNDVFKGLGNFPGVPYHIVIKENAIPVIDPPRRVPQSLMSELKATLSDLEKKGIISAVNKPTDWVDSLIVVEKPNGKLRICLDPRNLNKVIKREHRIIPSAEEIISRLEGKQIFSVLDLKDGFCLIPHDQFSSDLCTFNFPFGRYQFKRLPFGIASAPEVFEKRNQNIFENIP
ncbi:Uncharacterized protein K02A2.6 [Araneus ventricosus]|uniref:Uncharacterized protein K02A2.6 n=1 Tax=Araneus ventricosus TaxID=182803 RepID=A0A4Y2AJH5_ARAVE|nr:Uncharacterized protein K02A2.6 [Araneus ventricosus]